MNSPAPPPPNPDPPAQQTGTLQDLETAVQETLARERDLSHEEIAAAMLNGAVTGLDREISSLQSRLDVLTLEADSLGDQIQILRARRCSCEYVAWKLTNGGDLGVVH